MCLRGTGRRRSIKPQECQFTKSHLAGMRRGGGVGRLPGKVGVNEQELRKRLALLRSEHRDLDVAIAALTEAGDQRGFVDQLQMARLKKRKLALKDRIAAIEDVLLPDIIA